LHYFRLAFPLSSLPSFPQRLCALFIHLHISHNRLEMRILFSAVCSTLFEVTSDVSAWYSKHSTPNPLGVQPPSHVHLVDHDKFQA
jgi:hypothetical protein